MNPTQLPFVVEAALVLVAMTFGLLLKRAGKPYGKVKLVVHLFFFVWFTVGFCFISNGLLKLSVTKVIWIPVALLGLTILIQPVTGIAMPVSKKAIKGLQTIHLSSAVVMLLSDICAFIITGYHS